MRQLGAVVRAAVNATETTEVIAPRRVINAKVEARGALLVVGFSDDRWLVVLVLVLFVPFVFFVLHHFCFASNSSHRW